MVIRVGIAAVEHELRGALAALIALSDEFDVAEVRDSLDGQMSADGLDVIVVSENSGMERLLEVVDDVPSLVLGTGPDSMLAAVTSGAIGYLDVDAPLEDILDALRSVAGGVGTIPPEMLGTLLRQVVRRRRAERADRERLLVLSSRETQVFEQAALGQTNDGIAEKLFIATGTVRTHKQSIFKKLDLHSQAELVALAVRCGVNVIGEDGD